MKRAPQSFRPFRNVAPMSAAEIIASIGASKEDIAAVEAILGYPVPRLPEKLPKRPAVTAKGEKRRRARKAPARTSRRAA